MDFTLGELANKGSVILPEKPSAEVSNDRHMAMMAAIAPYAKTTQQNNVTSIYIDYKTRKSKIVFVLCPEWAPEFAPFNLLRLSGIAKSAGYESKVIDLNIETWNRFVNDWWPNKKIPFRLFDPSATWHWQQEESYENDIHPTIESMLMEACDQIEKINPDIVGFSIYYTNHYPTDWMVKELKRRMPNIKIAVGGSNVQKTWFETKSIYDYVVIGEGEQAILDILNEIEIGVSHDTVQVINQPENQRINLNGLPMPDYDGIDFSVYKIPNGITSELSRGCTAKCTFCEETHFWKYRQRQAVDIIDEAEWLYYNKGVDIIWFIDSLVNGNLRELRAFARAIQAKKLPTKWTGYARCDGRMDLEYFKDLANGGCIMLNYGVESGSQKVLNDMDKGVTIAEMEQNFRDGKEVGIWAATNWIVGFPTEEFQDFADTMTFLWRVRNMNINNVGAGLGFGLGAETIVGQNPHKFNVSYHKYQGHWITQDFTKGGTHLLIRVKTFYIFLDLIVDCAEHKFGYPIKPNLASEHYKIEFNDPSIINEVEYEKFDYNIIKPNLNPYADNLVNEIWPFLRTLWRLRGGYKFELKFHPEIDLKEYGDQFGPACFLCSILFEITHEGLWNADFKYSFNQIDKPELYYENRKSPFFAQDFSRMQNNTAKRARRLAKPNWNIETGRSEGDFHDLIKDEENLNKTIDFSFKYRYQGSGDWSNVNDYAVEISDKTSVVIPEKETLFNIDNIKK